MTQNSVNCVKTHALEMRKDIIRMIGEAGSGHPGGSLSCIDILATIYFGGVMKYDPEIPQLTGRDWFILCKGHAAPALYAVLAHAGFFPKEELMTLRKLGTRLQGHPDSNFLPGVEVGTGSLGQGLSIASGIAAGLKLDKKDGSVFALLGDGECEEGQVWEAAMFAAHNKLDNLIAIVDNNHLQIDGDIKDVAGLDALADKFASFGWAVSEMDGHCIEDITNTLTKARDSKAGTPQVIIAHTTKGKGISFMENQAGWHGKAPNAEQVLQALSELEAL